MGLVVMILVFWMLSFKAAFSLLFHFQGLFSSSSLSALEWYHLHIWGCWYFSQPSWFQLVLHPAQHFTWLNKQGDHIQPWCTPFPIEPVCCFMSSSKCCLLTCILVSQEAEKVVWYSHLFKNFPQFVVIQTVKGFSVVSEAEVDIFLEFSCFFYDSTDVSNLISGFSGFSKSSLNIWKSLVHVLLKTRLENLLGMSCPGTCWPLCGAWFQCQYGGIWWAPVN